jgi:dCMP deaminase
MSPDWQRTFLNIAQAAAGKSKDPSSKVGAVLVRPDKTVASLGFNGFPRRMADNPVFLNDPANRAEKLKRTVHAEMNCLAFNRDDTTEGYHLFVTRHPCSACALAIASSGITDVWWLYHEDFNQRWAESLAEAAVILQECSINMHRLD